MDRSARMSRVIVRFFFTKDPSVSLKFLQGHLAFLRLVYHITSRLSTGACPCNDGNEGVFWPLHLHIPKKIGSVAYAFEKNEKYAEIFLYFFTKSTWHLICVVLLYLLPWGAGMAQLVEHILGKDEVISSNLITSSRFPRRLTPAGIFLCLEGGGLQKIFCPVYPPLTKFTLSCIIIVPKN